MHNIDLEGKVAIVTGGGGGMGGAMSLALASHGASVCAADVNRDAADKIADEARKTTNSGTILPIAFDVTDFDDCARIVEVTRKELGPVNVLVNNAGVGMQTINENYMNEPAKFWLADLDRWQRMMDINFKGPFMMAKLVAESMVEQGWGRIINVTTSLDTMIRHNYSPYGQSKAALESGTATWAKDLEGSGVSVNVLVPGGPTNTGFIPESAPFDRDKLVQPEVMTGPVVWLASDRSDGITNSRFVASNWDASLDPDEAARAVCAPAAWPDAGTQAVWPGAN